MAQRITYKMIETFAAKNGIAFERKGKAFQYWKKSDSSSVGEAKTLREVWDDIQSFV